MRTVRMALFAVVALAIGAVNASAQTSIWLVPSTTTEPKGQIYVEGDAVVNPRSDANGGWQTGLGRVIYGVNNRCEVGANVMLARPYTAGEVQLNAKCGLYSNSNRGFAVAAGTMAYLPITNREYGDRFGLGYVVASKSFAATKGTTVTGGVWGLANRAEETGATRGVMLAVSQPITAKLSVAADWYSGDQIKGGYSATYVGAQIVTSPNSLLGVAFTRGNTGTNNNGAFVWWGYNFAR